MLWEIDVYPAPGQPDLLGRPVASAAAELGLAADLEVRRKRGVFDLRPGLGPIARPSRVAQELLTDRVVERAVVAPVGDERLDSRSHLPSGTGCARPRQRMVIVETEQSGTVPSGRRDLLVHVMPKPGVMDPVAQSVMSAIADFGLKAEVVRTLKKYWIKGLSDDGIGTLSGKVLANDAIEQVIVGPLEFRHLDLGSPHKSLPEDCADSHDG